jgi:hypothetical protein
MLAGVLVLLLLNIKETILYRLDKNLYQLFKATIRIYYIIKEKRLFISL